MTGGDFATPGTRVCPCVFHSVYAGASDVACVIAVRFGPQGMRTDYDYEPLFGCDL